MVVEESCDECGNTQNVCPSCGDHKVTRAEWVEKNGDRLPLMTGLKRTILEAEDGDEVKFGSICWECGWEKIRTLEIGVEEE